MDPKKAFHIKFEKKEKFTEEDFSKEIEEMKLKLRKNNLNKQFLQRRMLWLEQNKKKDNQNVNNQPEKLALNLDEISFLLFGNVEPLLKNKKLLVPPEDPIQLGLDQLYDYFFQKDKLSEADISYIKGNLYYKLLDLIKNQPNYIQKLIQIYIYLTSEIENIITNLFNDGFIPIVSSFFNNQIIYQNNKTDLITLLINLLSENEKIYIEVNKQINIGDLIRNLRKEGKNDDNTIDLIYMFIEYLPKPFMDKYIDIFNDVIQLFQKEYSQPQQENHLDDLLQIIIFFSKNEEFIQGILEQNFISAIADIITKKNVQLIHNAITLLSNLLKGTDNQKNQIISSMPYNVLPFLDQVKFYFTASLNDIQVNNSEGSKENQKYLQEYIHCIRCLLFKSDNSIKFYFNERTFFPLIVEILNSNVKINVKNEIIILLSIALEQKINIVNSYLMSQNCHKIVFDCLKNNMREGRIKRLISYNCLNVLNQFLEYVENEESKKNVTILEFQNMNFVAILDKLIDSEDTEISDLARHIRIKYFAEEESYYQASSIASMIIEKDL